MGGVRVLLIGATSWVMQAITVTFCKSSSSCKISLLTTFCSSKVYATDMYYTNFKENPMDPWEGRRYPKMVLAKGGSQHEMETLVQYLGRPPKMEALYRELGLT